MGSISSNQQKYTQKTVMNVLFNKDELSWKNVIMNLIDTNQMDPWDIDISKIAVEFMKILNKLSKMDFQITGKIVLASAILLKLKSIRLMETDMVALDNLISSQYEETDILDDEFYEDEAEVKKRYEREKPSQLVPRTPQPRKRKVSVYELIDALEKAIEVEVKRNHVLSRIKKPEIKVELSDRDISEVINELLTMIRNHYENTNELLTFEKLLPSQSKEDKVMTFIPLLHLDTQNDTQKMIDLKQKMHFGDIFIRLIGT